MPARLSSKAIRITASVLLMSLLAWPAFGATISGTVFEDRNYGGGAGRSLAASGGIGVPGVRVELYNGNDLVDSDTTDVSGVYSFTYSGHGARRVRVVNGTVRSRRANGAVCTACVPVQTFRAEAPSGTVVPVTDEVGGANPAVSDPTSTANNGNLPAAAQSVSFVDPSNSRPELSGIDFGFNFDTIVNTRDATSCGPTGAMYPCQGSLRQFIINANALGDEGALSQSGNGQIDGLNTPLPGSHESSIFMIPGGALASGVAAITLSGALPTLTGASTRLDATTQTVNIGNTNGGTLGTGGNVGVDNVSLLFFPRPEVQLNCAASGNAPLTLGGASQAILGFALRQGYILLSGTNGLARHNLVGMTAAGSSADDSPGNYGIAFSASGAIIRNNFITVNNSAIRSDGGGSGAIITLNEVARPTGVAGHTQTFDGILLINGVSNVQITANLVRDQRGGGIELGFGVATDSYVNVAVSNNTVSNNGFNSGTTVSPEPIGVVAYNVTGSNVTFTRNRIVNNGGAGMLIMAATGVAASQNSFSGNGGLAIDLDPVTRDPNTLGAPQGVTLNDMNDADAGPNGLLNYPVITSAVIMNGQLSIAGFARQNSAIELYIAQPDPSGYGEGLTYLTVLGENSGADLDATTGTYGPGAINGVVQGTDTTNRFAFRFPTPAGVAIGSVLTATATLGGQTSEFGGNLTVTSGPSLSHLKSVSVVSDPVNSTNPKSIPGAVQLYTLRITNQGAGGVDNNTISIVDAIPANTALDVRDVGAVGSGPVAFINGTPTSTLTYGFTSLASTTDNLEFSNDGGATWTYTPVPAADGYDPNVTHIRVRPQGAMAGGGVGGNPWFELRFKVRVN